MSYINELKEVQNKKIDYFLKKIGIRDISRAERYLNEANWDEKLAVAIFNKKYNPNYYNNLNNNNHEENQNNQDIQFQRPPPTVNSQRNNSRKMKKVNESEENYLTLKITQIIEDHKYNNGPASQTFSFLKNSLKTVELVFNNFLKTNKNSMHIILIYSEEAFSRKILNQIKALKRHNLYSMLEQSAIIFPVLNHSPIGKELSKQFLCVSFPSCLFCKFRDNDDLCVMNRMEGVFDVSFFYECILFEENKFGNEILKPNPSKNNLNAKNKNIPNRDNRIIMNENKNPNNIINELRESNYFNEGYENPFRNRKENQLKNNNLNQMNKRTEHNNKNRNNNRDISKDAIDKKKNENIKRNITQRRNDNDRIINQNYNQEFMDDYFLGNSQDLTKILKKIYGEQNDNNNNIQNGNHNDNDNHNHNHNHNQKDDDRKYNNNNYNNNNINNNINNNRNNNRNERNKEKNNSNKNINKNYNDRNGKDDPFKNVKNENLIRRDNMLADSIYGLTDAQVLAKRENEIKELERQQN